MGAAHDDFGATGSLLYFNQKHLEVLALAVSFVADLIVGAHDAASPVLVLGLMGIEVYKNSRSLFDAFNTAADQFTLVRGVFLENLFAFGFAKALHDNLAGGLSRDATGVVRNLFRFGDFVADLDVGSNALSFLQGNFGFGEFDLFNHGAQGEYADITSVGVQFNRQVLATGRIVAPEGRGQSNFNGSQYLIFRQAAFSG